MDINFLLTTSTSAAFKAGIEILKVYKGSDFGVEYKNDKSPLTIADKISHNIIHDLLKTTQIPILSEEGKDIPYIERKEWNLFWLIDPLDGTKEFINKNGEFTVNIALIENCKPILGIIYAPTMDILYYATYLHGSYKLDNLGKSIDDSITIDMLLADNKKIACSKSSNNYTIIVSRSHLSKQTQDYIAGIKNQHYDIELISIGSSLKFCLLAEGKADIYPRFGPTMEWDTAAGHAIAKFAGCKVKLVNGNNELFYNKKSLVNPWFIVESKNVEVLFDL